MERKQAKQAKQAGEISALGTFLTGASSVAAKWYPMQDFSSNGPQLPFGLGNKFASTPSEMLSGLYTPTGE
jgi:hypothetical protein